MGTRCSTFSEQSLTEQLTMKLLILIPLIASGYAAKLDRTYLPPASASSAGGSPGSLLAPGSGSFGRQPAGQSGIGAASFGSAFTKPGSYQPSQTGFQSGSQPSSGFRQPSESSGYEQTSAFAGYGSGPFNQPSGSGAGFGSSSARQSNYLGTSQSGYNQGSSLEQNQGLSNIQAYNQPQRAQAAAEQGAEVLRYDSQNDGETFSYSFETSNGIRADESGVATNGVRAQGSFGYAGDDGQDYSITYTADENGYQPQGEHLPTPHPIPEEILKSIEENARAAAAGTQEGAYRPEEYEKEGGSESYKIAQSSSNKPSQGPSQLYGAPQFNSGINQEAQGYNQGYPGNNALEKNQNQGIGQGQSIAAPGSQQQSQFVASGPVQDFTPSGSQGPQAQSLFGQGTGANQVYGQSSFGQGGANQGQGYSGQGSQGQSGFGQGGSNQGQRFGGQGSAGQSGYEYNRPQGPGQFGSPSSGQSGPQDSSTSFSRPGTGPSQGYFAPSAKGPKNSYIAPSQQGQGSQYRPGQSTFGSGPSGSSFIGQIPTGPQNQYVPPSGQFSSGVNQGKPTTFGGPRQPPSFSAQEGYKY